MFNDDFPALEQTSVNKRFRFVVRTFYCCRRIRMSGEFGSAEQSRHGRQAFRLIIAALLCVTLTLRVRRRDATAVVCCRGRGGGGGSAQQLFTYRIRPESRVRE